MAPREKGSLPKAYLRLDPDINETHPEWQWKVLLDLKANRQPHRGRFAEERLIVSFLGRARFERFKERRDLISEGDAWYVNEWDELQEGDFTVGDRMTRWRAKRKHRSVSQPLFSRNAVTGKKRS